MQWVLTSRLQAQAPGEAGFTSPVADAACAGHGEQQGLDAHPKLRFPGDSSTKARSQTHLIENEPVQKAEGCGTASHHRLDQQLPLPWVSQEGWSHSWWAGWGWPGPAGHG